MMDRGFQPTKWLPFPLDANQGYAEDMSQPWTGLPKDRSIALCESKPPKGQTD